MAPGKTLRAELDEIRAELSRLRETRAADEGATPASEMSEKLAELNRLVHEMLENAEDTIAEHPVATVAGLLDPAALDPLLPVDPQEIAAERALLDLDGLADPWLHETRRQFVELPLCALGDRQHVRLSNSPNAGDGGVERGEFFFLFGVDLVAFAAKNA